MGRQAVSFDDFIKEIDELGNHEYTLVSGKDTYRNKKSKVTLRHNICGYLWETNRDNFVNRGNRCKLCAKQVQWTKETLQEFLNKKYNNQYVIIQSNLKDNDIIHVKDNIEIFNRKCSHSYTILVSILLHRDSHNCKVCGKYKRTSLREFKMEMEKEVGNEYEIIDDKVNSTHDLVKVKHNICGNAYKVSRTNFLGSPNREGRRCPYCSNTKPFSNKEIELKNYISSIYDGTIITNDRSVLNGKELDIYLPDKKLAIEFDGLYWHTEDRGKDKNYHLNKTQLCEEKGIRLIHIFEDEWNEHKDIVKSKIKHIMNEDDNPKIYARKCYVEEISSSDKNKFLESNHIQGSDKSNIKLGLWYPCEDGDELVAVMTFCKPRLALGQKKDSEYDYELSRFATENSYRVIGAFGKLWKYFERNYDFNSIITYADRRWSSNINSNVYKTNGFKLSHISRPNYWYTDFNCTKREYRFTYRKSKLEKLFPDIYDKDKSEKQIMLEAGYHRIYDCGNLVYIYERKV